MSIIYRKSIYTLGPQAVSFVRTQDILCSTASLSRRSSIGDSITVQLKHNLLYMYTYIIHVQAVLHCKCKEYKINVVSTHFTTFR